MAKVVPPLALTLNSRFPVPVLRYCVSPGKGNELISAVSLSSWRLIAAASGTTFTTRIFALLLPLFLDVQLTSTSESRHSRMIRARRGFIPCLHGQVVEVARIETDCRLEAFRSNYHPRPHLDARLPGRRRTRCRSFRRR